MLQQGKSLFFHILEARKMYPFRAEPLRISYYREFLPTSPPPFFGPVIRQTHEAAALGEGAPFANWKSPLRGIEEWCIRFYKVKKCEILGWHWKGSTLPRRIQHHLFHQEITAKKIECRLMKMKAGGCLCSVLEFKGEFQYFTSSQYPPHMNFHVSMFPPTQKTIFLKSTTYTCHRYN